MAGPPDPKICTVTGPVAQFCANAPDGTAATAVPHMMKARRNLIMGAPSDGLAGIDWVRLGMPPASYTMRFVPEVYGASGSRMRSGCAGPVVDLGPTEKRASRKSLLLPEINARRGQ